MEILDREQIGLALFRPLRSSPGLAFWAMAIAARAISIAFVPAFGTPLEMAAQSGRATGSGGAQDTLLCWGLRGSMRLAKFFTMGAHDIGNFDSGPHWTTQCGLGLRRSGRTAEEVQGTGGSTNSAGRYTQITGGGRKTAMTQ
jgi:hypothetical protein